MDPHSFGLLACIREIRAKLTSKGENIRKPRFHAFGPFGSGSVIYFIICMDPDPSINKQKNEKNTLISTVLSLCDFFTIFIFKKSCKCTIS